MKQLKKSTIINNKYFTATIKTNDDIIIWAVLCLSLTKDDIIIWRILWI